MGAHEYELFERRERKLCTLQLISSRGIEGSNYRVATVGEESEFVLRLTKRHTRGRMN